MLVTHLPLSKLNCFCFASISSSVSHCKVFDGHTLAHIGGIPSFVRSIHKSHLYMRFCSVSNLGIPYGQAIVQFWQPMHFSTRAERTAPVSWIWMACAGQLLAHAGFTQ